MTRIECLNFIRMFQSSYYHRKIKIAARDIRSSFSFKAEENNTEDESLKVNSVSDLVKSSEVVTLADVEAVNKDLKAAT